jgi:probable rRNA maturation factor
MPPQEVRIVVEIEIITGEDVSEELPVDPESLRRHARAIMSGNGFTRGEVNIVFIGDDYMAGLNRTYRGREGTTDVLSFNLTDEFTEGLSGEVYVSLARAGAQALEYGVSFAEEVVRLATHGLLHLVGHLHDTDARNEEMTQRTDELVKEFFSGRGGQ